jgi:hypothetical protein
MVAALWVLAAAANVQGGTLAFWDNAGQTGNQAFTPGVGSAHIVAADMVRGSGLGTPSAGNSLSSNNWSGVSADDYIEFGFAVEPGYEVSLGDLRIGTQSSASGPGLMGVYTSTDGFFAPVLTINQGPGGNRVNSIVSLSDLGRITGSFSVRLIQVGDAAANGGIATASTGSFRVADYSPDDGVTYTDTFITGESTAVASAVPIPGAAWLLGLGLAGLARFRRTPAR